MNRKFGVEIEACLVVEFNREYMWIDYIKEYLKLLSYNLKLSNEYKFSSIFENTVIIKTEKYDEDAIIYKYNLITNECFEDSDYEIDYKFPIICPDYSVVCHDYIHGFINMHQHPSEYNESSVHKRNYLLNSKYRNNFIYFQQFFNVL